MPDTPAPYGRLLTLDDLKRKLGVSRTATWNLRRRPDFPRPVLIGEARKFIEAEVDDWIASQPREDAPQATNAPASDGNSAGGAARA